jgi:hypothetical protein
MDRHAACDGCLHVMDRHAAACLHAMDRKEENCVRDAWHGEKERKSRGNRVAGQRRKGKEGRAR